MCMHSHGWNTQQIKCEKVGGNHEEKRSGVSFSEKKIRSKAIKSGHNEF